MHSEQINEISIALSKAQGEMIPAYFDKENPHFKSKYASLSAIWDCCRDPLSKNGLAIIQILSCKDDFISLETMLTHSSGQWFKSVMPVYSAKSTPQALGSAITYMKRYSLSAMIGICTREDDDAEDSEQLMKQQSFSHKSPPEVKKEIKKIPGYDELCEKAGIIDGSDKMKYIDESLKSCKLSKIEYINFALLSPVRFQNSFDKWNEQRLFLSNVDHPQD